ncbi:MAG TPA: histidine kinase dimerization/phosphoacceptor domain -containing protein [Bacteroidia bacterium]|jgi:two-component sensor histidine kinase|nr:histidine kinase dimerization/phosphoacceptor domain -containing protein [Bacteroidia bacterium]
MRVIWNSISSLGVYHGKDETTRNRIVLINQFHGITLFLILAGITNLVILSDYHSAFLLSGAALLLTVGLYINSIGFFNAAACCLLFSVNMIIFYFSSYLGKESGVYFFYFPAAMCTAFLFDFRRQKAFFLFHFFFMSALVVIMLVSELKLFTGPAFSQAYIRQVFAFDLIASVLLLIFFIHLVTKSNELRHQELLVYIDQRKAAEESTRASLREKETLLAEVHHRVKNNLAVISGLLSLQINSANNDYTRDILLDCKSRVTSMALVHEKLYRSQSLAEIDLHAYLPDLIHEIRNSFADYDARIQIELSVPHVFMTVSEAIPCGLILNELITNSYKHAFDGQAGSAIFISVVQTEKQISISVADNGKGLPAGFDLSKASSLGLILIESLVDQLDGKYEMKGDHGTQFSFTFTPS